MPATRTNLTDEHAIEQGADWAHGWAVRWKQNPGDEFEPIDGTWSARGQVRKTKAAGAVLHEFAAEVTAEGYVVISVAAAESVPWAWRSGVYDVEVTNADESVTLRVAEGSVAVDAEVTR